MSKSSKDEFIGFDLGHGETAIGRAFGGAVREPEILEFRGERSFVTAIAKTKDGVKIGADAVNLSYMDGSADVWVKFKSRELGGEAAAKPTKLFAKTLIESLSAEGVIGGAKESRFIIGCPSGWDAPTRAQYKSLFQAAGLKTVRIVAESRAALMTALEQGYMSIDDARAAVLIIDIGSSTTDLPIAKIWTPKMSAIMCSGQVCSIARFLSLISGGKNRSGKLKS